MFHIEGSNTLNFVRDHVLKKDDLFNIFKNLLKNEGLGVVDEASIETLQKELYEDLISRFCLVAGNQFRKDLKRSFGISKSEALRKRVVFAKQKKESKITKLSMASILSDNSEKKISSHLKLKSRICDDGVAALDNFIKKELLDLCKAYCIRTSRSSDKKSICEKLVSVIPTTDSVPDEKHLSKDNEESGSRHQDEEQPSTSGIASSIQQASTSGSANSTPQVERPTTSTGRKRKKRKSSLTCKRQKRHAKSTDNTVYKMKMTG